jgi:CRP-like cAMP-binding protein
MLMGTASLTNARGKADESEILEVPADRLRQALAELPGVSETIVRAFIMRQQRLRGKFGLEIFLKRHFQKIDDLLGRILRNNPGSHRFVLGLTGKHHEVRR